MCCCASAHEIWCGMLHKNAAIIKPVEISTLCDASQCALTCDWTFSLACLSAGHHVNVSQGLTTHQKLIHEKSIFVSSRQVSCIFHSFYAAYCRWTLAGEDGTRLINEIIIVWNTICFISNIFHYFLQWCEKKVIQNGWLVCLCTRQRVIASIVNLSCCPTDITWYR